MVRLTFTADVSKTKSSFDHKPATRIEAPWTKRGQVMEPERSVPTLAEVEREHILKTLDRCNGNRTRTANLLGISMSGLRIKLHEYQRAGFDILAPNQSPDAAAASPQPFGSARRPLCRSHFR
jgi:DNA-binding NtrC family response regulator